MSFAWRFHCRFLLKALSPWCNVTYLFIFISFADWQGILDCCQLLLSQYEALLSPLNIVIIKLHQEVLGARLELQQWTEALETAEVLLKPYQ